MEEKIERVEYYFWCEKCNKKLWILCTPSVFNQLKCKECEESLKNIGQRCVQFHIPMNWTNPDNDFNIAKPKTALEKKKYRNFMENSIPISRSTT